MRIFVASNGQKILEERLPFDDALPTPVPDELRGLLKEAPTLSGAAFAVEDLGKALAAWKVAHGEVQQATDGHEAELEVMLLPLLLILGRDLMLLGQLDWEVSVQ